MRAVTPKKMDHNTTLTTIPGWYDPAISLKVETERTVSAEHEENAENPEEFHHEDAVVGVSD